MKRLDRIEMAEMRDQKFEPFEPKDGPMSLLQTCPLTTCSPSTRLATRFGPVRFASSQFGFTFIEVLFAIIILGVGMIMIAGILPVAIKQQSDTRDEMLGKTVTENAYASLYPIIQNNPSAFVPTNFSAADPPSPAAPYAQGDFSSIGDLHTLLNRLVTLPVDTRQERIGKVVPLNFEVTNEADLRGTFNNPREFYAFDSIAGSRVLSADPRFQYMAFYRRDQDARFIRLILVAMKLQNTDQRGYFGYGTDGENTLKNEKINADNGPFLFDVEIIDQTLEPDRLVFRNPDPNYVDAIGPGAFIIIADSRAPGGNRDLQRPFRNNGRVFRLGAQRLDVDGTGNTYDLATGFDLPSASNGPDGIPNTADDVIDGSMDTNSSYPVTNAGSTTNEAGSVARAWLIGRGLQDPRAVAGTGNRYAGPVQDIGVLSIDVPLP